MAQKFWVDQNGNYLGGFDGPGQFWNGITWGPAPPGAVQVPSPPAFASQKWSNGAWSAPPSSVAAIDAPTLAAALIAKGVLAQSDVNAAVQANSGAAVQSAIP